MQLLHGPSVVRHMFENMAADDDVERLVRELEVGHIQSRSTSSRSRSAV